MNLLYYFLPYQLRNLFVSRRADSNVLIVCAIKNGVNNI